MFTELLLFLVLILAGLLAIISTAVLVSVFKRGPAGIAELSRRGVGIRSWASGGIPDFRDGTSIDLIEGIEISAKGRQVSKARQTRGISAEH
jgi:hypothetical protein